MDHDFPVYFCACLPAVRYRTAGFRSATFSVVETLSGTLCQDISYILTRVDGRLPALDSEPAITTSSDPLGPGNVPPPSYRVVCR